MSEPEEKLYYATIDLTNRYTIGVWAKDMEEARIKAAVKIKREYKDMKPRGTRPVITEIKVVERSTSKTKKPASLEKYGLTGKIFI